MGYNMHLITPKEKLSTLHIENLNSQPTLETLPGEKRIHFAEAGGREKKNKGEKGGEKKGQKGEGTIKAELGRGQPGLMR